MFNNKFFLCNVVEDQGNKKWYAIITWNLHRYGDLPVTSIGV